MAVDRLMESVFHCMLLACFGITDPGLNFYPYFFWQLKQVYFAEAVWKQRNKDDENQQPV
jgi:hypothetical protein